MLSIEIRVGLCRCMDLYDGKLEGRRFVIGGKRYVISEVRLPDETYHTKSLKAARCHFFIDNGAIHPQEISIFLEKEDLVASPSGRSEKLVSSMRSGMTTERYVLRDDRWIMEGKPLSARGMIRALRWFVAKMSAKERTRWLKRMSLKQTAVT